MIPTGIPLHRPMTVAALEAGMHVLVYKRNDRAGKLEAGGVAINDSPFSGRSMKGC